MPRSQRQTQRSGRKVSNQHLQRACYVYALSSELANASPNLPLVTSYLNEPPCKRNLRVDVPLSVRLSNIDKTLR